VAYALVRAASALLPTLGVPRCRGVEKSLDAARRSPCATLFAAKLFMRRPLMVVNNLYVFRCAFPPAKTDPPLVVDPDAVLPLSVTGQRFKSVSWYRRDVFQRCSIIEHPEFPARHFLDVAKLAAAVAVEELLSVPAAEGPDHNTAYHGSR